MRKTLRLEARVLAMMNERKLGGVTHTVKRYSQFLMVGTFNAIVDILVFNLLLIVMPWHTAIALSAYNTLAVVAAISNSYIWNRHLTFRDVASGSKREKWLFLLQALLNLVLNNLTVVWVSTYLVLSHDVPYFIRSNAAKALAMLLSSAVSYLCMRYIVFRSAKVNRRAA